MVRLKPNCISVNPLRIVTSSEPLTWDVIRDTPAAELAKQLAKTDDLSERWSKKLNLSSPPDESDFRGCDIRARTKGCS